MEVGKDYVECPICGARLRCLNGHLKVHNISTREFMEKYPEAPMVCDNAHILRNKQGSPPLIQRRLYQYLTSGLGLSLKWEAHVGSLFFDIADMTQYKAIEVDGTYFHKESGSLNDTQLRNKEFSDRKAMAAHRLGWQVLHVTDKELTMSPMNAVDKILNFLDVSIGPLPDDLNLIPDKPIYCAHCGKHLTFEQIYSNRNTCSRECADAYRAAHPENKPCEECGKVQTYAGVNGHRFCSQDCEESWKAAHVKHTSICLACGKIIYVTGQQPHVFCNASCQKAYAHEHPEEWKKLKGDWSADSEYNIRRRAEGRVEYVCANCGKPGWKHARSLRKSQEGRLFCCAACYHAYTKNKPRKRN